MASAVDIANLALAHLGDTATVASIDPPEGSAQAVHCARFYPIARDMMLDKMAWSFATKRVALAQVTNTSAQWLYAYAMPAGVVGLLAVLPSEATGDYSLMVDSLEGATEYAPQDYTIEVDTSGHQIILTNTENALLRYTFIATDTTQYSPLFVLALSWLLASFIAGPLIKGDVGSAEAKRCLGMYQVFEAQAEASDANQSKATLKQATPWITGR